MSRVRSVLVGLLLLGFVVVVLRLLRHDPHNEAPHGVMEGSKRNYDWMTRILFGSFYRGVAENISEAAPEGGRILEIGCGPGHLTTDLADRGFEVTGMDLDPEMIERADMNARSRLEGHLNPPSFDVGDVMALPYEDDSFDLVTSTFSMHHWEDPATAMAEISRVLKPGGRALIWDFGSGNRFFTHYLPDPESHLEDTPLEMVSNEPWKWSLWFTSIQRMEIRPMAEEPIR